MKGAGAGACAEAGRIRALRHAIIASPNKKPLRLCVCSIFRLLIHENSITRPHKLRIPPRQCRGYITITFLQDMTKTSIVVLLLVAASQLPAQVAATLSGTVTDPSGAVVSGA